MARQRREKKETGEEASLDPANEAGSADAEGLDVIDEVSREGTIAQSKTDTVVTTSIQDSEALDESSSESESASVPEARSAATSLTFAQ